MVVNQIMLKQRKDKSLGMYQLGSWKMWWSPYFLGYPLLGRIRMIFCFIFIEFVDAFLGFNSVIQIGLDLDWTGEPAFFFGSVLLLIYLCMKPNKSSVIHLQPAVLLSKWNELDGLTVPNMEETLLQLTKLKLVKNGIHGALNH